MKKVEDILNEREKTHGSYNNQAYTAQTLKRVLRSTPNAMKMPSFMSESIDHITTKISRISHGEYTNIDSWKDIAGYAQLVVRELEK